VKQPQRISHRQLKLLESETAIQADQGVRGEVVSALADLLLEALGASPGGTEEASNEPED
jgi:hypothetical protein